MRHVLLVALLTAMLAACGNPQPSADTNAAILEAFAKVCSFKPTPGTIAAIVAAWDIKAGAAAGVIEGVVEQACAQLVKEEGPNFALAKSVVIKSPSGKEVRVEGEFVGKAAKPTPPPPAPAPAPEAKPVPELGSPAPEAAPEIPAWKPVPNCPGCESAPAPSDLKPYHEVQPGPPDSPKFGQPKQP